MCSEYPNQLCHIVNKYQAYYIPGIQSSISINCASHWELFPASKSSFYNSLLNEIRRLLFIRKIEGKWQIYNEKLAYQCGHTLNYRISFSVCEVTVAFSFVCMFIQNISTYIAQLLFSIVQNCSHLYYFNLGREKRTTIIHTFKEFNLLPITD